METSRGSWKFKIALVAIVVVGLGAFVATKFYDEYLGRKAVKDAAEAMKKASEDSYVAAMNDRIGGKTPQETLRLYIEAVEKGDYVLASKYFIGDYQEKELENLKNKTSTGVEKYISTLTGVSASSGGYFSNPDGEEFIVDKPIYIRMRAYPNGIWKIIEI